MKFGVAKDLITPDVRTHMGGYGTLYGKYFTGIHDDLYVKTLVMDAGWSKVVLMTFDLLMHDYALSETIADYVRAEYGLPTDHVVVSYTHSHAGPAAQGYDPDQASDAYEAFLWGRIKSCIDRAFINTFDGTISFGRAKGDWSISRRRMDDGKVVMLPSPEGPRDDTLNVLRICDDQGNTRVLLLNYGCHPVTLGDTLRISSEYPGRLCRHLDTRFYGSTAMFFQGAGGSSRPRITAGVNAWKKCSFDEVDDMASVMANSAQRAIETGRLAPIDLQLDAGKFVVSLETEVYPRAFFENIALNGNVPDSPRKNEAQVVLDNYDRTDNVIRLHAGIVRLNDDLYIAWLCGEVCYEVKQHVEKAFGDKNVIFIGYCDGSAYIPDDAMIAEGGYEVERSVVEFCLKGKFKPGINRKITDAFRANLQSLEGTVKRNRNHR